MDIGIELEYQGATKLLRLEIDPSALDLHRFDDNEPYYLGMFLNGAYQEILGDLHNLFGDTHAVHVALSEEGYQIRHVIKGDSVTDVLRYVEYVPENMIEAVRRQAERACLAPPHRRRHRGIHRS